MSNIDFSQIKSFHIPEGDVKEIYVNGTKMWELVTAEWHTLWEGTITAGLKNGSPTLVVSPSSATSSGTSSYYIDTDSSYNKWYYYSIANEFCDYNKNVNLLRFRITFTKNSSKLADMISNGGDINNREWENINENPIVIDATCQTTNTEFIKSFCKWQSFSSTYPDATADTCVILSLFNTPSEPLVDGKIICMVGRYGKKNNFDWTSYTMEITKIEQYY